VPPLPTLIVNVVPARLSELVEYATSPPPPPDPPSGPPPPPPPTTRRLMFVALVGTDHVQFVPDVKV
jgi:hypothetical protein